MRGRISAEGTPRSGLTANPPPIMIPNAGPKPPPGVPLDIKIPNVQPANAPSGPPAIHTDHRMPMNSTPRTYRVGKPGM
jgi:hypothetical protein